jgi:hypothetical protein
LDGVATEALEVGPFFGVIEVEEVL